MTETTIPPDSGEPGGQDHDGGAVLAARPTRIRTIGEAAREDRAAAPTSISPGLAGLAGVLAAAVALGVGELISALNGTNQSLVGGVGTWFIDRFSGSLKDFAVSTFGTNDKTALVVGILAITLGVGFLVGWAAVKRPWVATLAFCVFGLVGLAAGWGDPQSSQGLVAAAAIGSVAAGLLTLFLLLRVARTGSAAPSTSASRARVLERPTEPSATRRAFFGWAGAAGAFAATATVAGRAMSGRSKAEQARSLITLPRANEAVGGGGGGTLLTTPGAPMGVDGLTPYFVPNPDFYRIDAALVVPQVDPDTWNLSINGMVDRPFSLTFDELLKMPQVEQPVTIACVSNEVGDKYVGNAKWQGVPLRDILDRAGVQPGATQIVGKSVDGWTAGFPTDVALDGRVAMVAVGMNGEPLPVIHGFPARLIVAGLYGYVSATKWISEIRLTRWEDFDGYWIDRGWSKKGPIKTQSRIDVPKAGARVDPGPVAIAGVAWAPTRGISKVEVQVDDGPWQPAKLGDAASNNTWVQWVYEWQATPGLHPVRVRATDGTGETQTDKIAPPEPDGATGYHSRTVRVND